MSGLLDFLQSASNSVAGNVSAPVDGLAWLLRKAGLDVGEPVGGSDWMQRQGLTRPVKQGAASLAGETAGLLSPMLATAKAPQIARGLLSLDDKAMDMARQAVEKRMSHGGLLQSAIDFPNSPKAFYHGSAKEIDEFNPSLLGSNTGADDAHAGFHFADNKADADFYASMAAKKAGADRGVVGKFDLDMKKPLVISPFPEDGNIPSELIEALLEDKMRAKAYALENGFDGIVYPHGTNVDSAYTAIAFKPGQVKKIAQ